MKLAPGAGRAECDQSLPVRGAWIEIPTAGTDPDGPQSLPVRGAWIEILEKKPAWNVRPVAPRKGSVD